ncbi:MAG TPA: permease, partial [Aggregatilineales bacterium]|nr:permease [Aggregatilineales bacterium]
MQFDLSVFATRFLGIFIEAAPFLLLGTLASGLIEAFVNKDDIARIVPKNIILATMMGGMMGFMFPVCECGVVPVTRRLFRKGLPMSVGIAFLLSAPVMNPVVVASTYAAFGATPIFFLRFIVSAIVAISVGLIFAFQPRPQRILRPQSVLLPVGGGSDAAIALPVQPRIALLPGLK